MSKHTPGPWTARLNDPQYWKICCGQEPTLGYTEWDELASVWGSDDEPRKGKAVAEANARLIAAAPDLLAACVSALDCWETESLLTDAVVNTLRNAIAKAKGGDA